MKLHILVIAALALLHSMPALSQDAKSPRSVPADKQSWTKAVGFQIQRRSVVAVSRARMEGIDGNYSLKVGFQLHPDGAISNVRVIESSGNLAVDRIATDMPALASPFPAFTPDMQSEPVSIVAPIVLKLEAPAPHDEGRAGE